MNCPICSSLEKEASLLPPASLWFLRYAPLDKNLPGYLYLESKRHVESLASLEPQEWLTLGPSLQEGIRILQESTPKPEKVYVSLFAEKVPHIHFHLVPRYAGQEPGINHLNKALNQGFPQGVHYV